MKGGSSAGGTGTSYAMFVEREIVAVAFIKVSTAAATPDAGIMLNAI